MNELKKKLVVMQDKIDELRLENAQVYTMMDCMGQEITRLRGLLAAPDVAPGVAPDNPAPGAPWRVLASDLRHWGLTTWGGIMDAIADWLDEEPE